ncbi:hypothetical protein [Chelatococcus reniformis]|uniref:Uncharacterized protein n=1 Tax=Chelatococcus reniformis TaxID=1494448 RepID=A0A916UR02_9HYPH|nr:hypothetical protein [Chelatococcus reniformis]GGC84037.1 hypothetical protein GCM10010994_47420 [Chelatococcus reniformis]
MANIPTHPEFSDSGSLPALGLRWAALRGMLASPLIDAEDQRDLRRELLQELKTVEQSMARVASRSALELCTKIDVVSQSLREQTYPDGRGALELLDSIRADVSSLIPRADNKGVHLSRATVVQRPTDQGGAAQG